MNVFPSPPPGPPPRLQSSSSVVQINPGRNDKFRFWPLRRSPHPAVHIFSGPSKLPNGPGAIKCLRAQILSR